MEDVFVSAYGYFFFSLLIVWATAWKGIALWRAARNNSVVWYVILLLVNTVGILEIIYIFLVSPRKKSEKDSRKK